MASNLQPSAMMLISVSLLITAGQVMGEADIIYEYTDNYGLIWNDKGSGGNHDVSFWAPYLTGDYCILGHIAVGNYNKPTSKAVIVKENGNRALKHPTGFTQIWNDNWSGANHDVAIYKMNAPPGYTCLGDVAINSHSSTPSRNDFCCVKNEYVVRGDFAWTYNDKGSGALHDFSCWTVKKASNSNGLAGGNFLSANGYSNSDLTGYLLGGNELTVVEDGSIKSSSLRITSYKLDNENKLSRIVSAQTIELENNSDLEQTTTGVLSYTYSKSSTYTSSNSYTLGLSIAISLGIPEIASATTTFSGSATATFQNGKTKSSSMTHEVRAAVRVPPKNKVKATLIATEYTSNIPFKGSMSYTTYGGGAGGRIINGVYKGVDVGNFKVTYGEFENIN